MRTVEVNAWYRICISQEVKVPNHIAEGSEEEKDFIEEYFPRRHLPDAKCYYEESVELEQVDI